MPDDLDLTARLMELREVLHNEIEAVQTLVTARQDGQDSARQILLDRLRSDTGLLREELDRRFTDARRETDERFTATIAMRVALQAEMDRRFTGLDSQLNRRFGDSERAVGAALDAAKEATGKAEEASNRRFDSVNEFRQTLTDQASTFLTRAEYDASTKAIAERVAINADRVAAVELRLTSRLDRGEGADTGTRNYQSEQREIETLTATLKQAAVASPLRANLAAAFSGIAVLVSVIVLILDLTAKH